MYEYIENTVSIDVTENYDILESAGEAFGGFQQMLSDFNADSLYETIKRFHDTPYRVEQLETAIKNAKTDIISPKFNLFYQLSNVSTSFFYKMMQK